MIAGSRPPGTTGLYHVAVRFPDRATMSAAVRRVLDPGIRLDGASYHGVSEAIYLSDPDGNNIEAVYHGPAERSAPSVVLKPLD